MVPYQDGCLPTAGANVPTPHVKNTSAFFAMENKEGTRT